MRSRLGRVKGCAAMAAPFHVAIAAAAPDRGDFPAGVAVGVAVRAACWWHDHPAALGRYEVADKVVREVIAAWIGHRDVLPRTSDKNLGDGTRPLGGR